MLPYIATIVVLALISAQRGSFIRINMPASHRQAVPPRVLEFTHNPSLFCSHLQERDPR